MVHTCHTSPMQWSNAWGRGPWSARAWPSLLQSLYLERCTNYIEIGSNLYYKGHMFHHQAIQYISRQKQMILSVESDISMIIQDTIELKVMNFMMVMCTTMKVYITNEKRVEDEILLQYQHDAHLLEHLFMRHNRFVHGQIHTLWMRCYLHGWKNSA